MSNLNSSTTTTTIMSPNKIQFAEIRRLSTGGGGNPFDLNNNSNNNNSPLLNQSNINHLINIPLSPMRGSNYEIIPPPPPNISSPVISTSTSSPNNLNKSNNSLKSASLILQDILRENELSELSLSSNLLPQQPQSLFQEIDIENIKINDTNKTLIENKEILENNEDLINSINNNIQNHPLISSIGRMNLKQTSTAVPTLSPTLKHSTNNSTFQSFSSTLKASSSNAFSKLNQSGSILKISSVANYFVNPLKYSVYSEGHMILNASQSNYNDDVIQVDSPENNEMDGPFNKSTGIFKRSGLTTIQQSPDGANLLNDLECIELDKQEEEGIDTKDELRTTPSVLVNDGSIKFKVQKFANNNRGYILLILASFLFSIMAYVVKKVSTDLSCLEIAFMRSFYGLVGCFIILFSIRENPLGPKQFRALLFLRGISGTISLCAYFFTITVLPLSEAVIISFTSPVITAALAAVILKEKWGLVEAFCAFLSLCGVTVISKPAFLFDHGTPTNTSEHGDDSGGNKLLYVLIGIIGAFFTAVSYIAVRKVGSGVNPFILVVYSSVVASFTTLPSAFIFQSFVWPSLKLWGYITLMGVIATCAQASVNAGIQCAKKTSQAAAMNYLQIIFTLLWSLLFLNDNIDWQTLLGAALILGCAVVTIVKK